MAKQTWANINGTWKKAVKIWSNIGGVWKSSVIPKGFVGGSWKEFMSYGAWLYKYPGENIANFVQGYSSGGTVKSFNTNNSGRLYVYAGDIDNVNSNTAVTDLPIDLTGYTTLHYEYAKYGDANASSNIYISSAKMVNSTSSVVNRSHSGTVGDANNGVYVLFTLGVSSLQGSFYINVQAKDNSSSGGLSTVYVKNMWLE